MSNLQESLALAGQHLEAFAQEAMEIEVGIAALMRRFAEAREQNWEPAQAALAEIKPLMSAEDFQSLTDGIPADLHKTVHQTFTEWVLKIRSPKVSLAEALEAYVGRFAAAAQSVSTPTISTGADK